MGRWGKCNICDVEITYDDLGHKGIPHLNPDNDNPICSACHESREVDAFGEAWLKQRTGPHEEA